MSGKIPDGSGMYDMAEGRNMQMKKSISIVALSTALLLPTVTAEASQPKAETGHHQIEVDAAAFKTLVYSQPLRWAGGQWTEKDLNQLIQRLLAFKGQGTVKPPAAGNKDTEKPDGEKPAPKPDTEKPEIEKPEPAPEIPETDKNETPETQQPEVEQPEVQQPDAEKPEVQQPDVEQPEVQKPDAEKPEAQQPDVPQPDTEQPEAEKPAPAPVQPQQPQQPETEKPSAGQTAGLSAVEQKVLDLTNAERSKAGLKPLAADAKLMDAAREKSADMRKNHYFSHTSPVLGSPFDRMKALGISYRSAAENIAMGQTSPEEVVKAWMESPGHRQNILTPGFTHIGIGYDPNGHYWTQQFI